MTYTIMLPTGDEATAPSFEAAMLAVETLVEDAARYLRENVVIHKDGAFDENATNAAQQGLVV